MTGHDRCANASSGGRDRSTRSRGVRYRARFALRGIWKTDAALRQFYQPIVNLRSGQIVGLESLLRLLESSDGPSTFVNVSASDMNDPDFVNGLVALTQPHPVSKVLLKLELTESVLLDDIERASRYLQFLRSTGIRMALDDFGTG